MAGGVGAAQLRGQAGGFGEERCVADFQLRAAHATGDADAGNGLHFFRDPIGTVKPEGAGEANSASQMVSVATVLEKRAREKQQ